MTLAGLNINSATAAVTDAILVTAAGVTIANCFLSFTGALAGNPPVEANIAPGFKFIGNRVSAHTTAAIVTLIGACTDFVIADNFLRLLVTAGTYVNTAATSSGLLAKNFGKTIGAAPLAGAGFVIGGATLVGNFENYSAVNTVAAGTIATGA
jgi:hypothetical protein